MSEKGDRKGIIHDRTLIANPNELILFAPIPIK